ncbi:MAG: DUF2306 domain-containing protein [Actinomycetota bacterium]
MAWDVVAMYVALAVWGLTLAWGIRRGGYGPFIIWGLVLLVVLNGRYFIEGPPAGIAFFVGLYDVFDNIGLASNEGAAALATCPDNACTVWDSRYLHHPAWGVAFYERFANATALRTNLLYTHIGLNTIAFLLMHLQLARPGGSSRGGRHRLVGRAWFLALVLGTGAAVWLSSEHSAVEEYGGILAELGFYSMSAFVFVTALIGVRHIRAGDMASHRRWMFRHAGAMWGAFWLFRVMLVFTGPIFREMETVSILLSIWLSAPLGIVIAEMVRRRLDERRTTPEPVPESAPSAAV